MNDRLAILITILVLLLPPLLLVHPVTSSQESLSGLYGAAAGLLAIVWLYRSLALQRAQSAEQSRQFITQLKLSSDDSQFAYVSRLAELLEREVGRLHETLHVTDAGQLAAEYMRSMKHYRTALESSDPDLVQEAVTEWLNVEGPCMRIVSILRDLIIIERRRNEIAEPDSDSDDPVDFVYVNQSLVLNKPLVRIFSPTLSFLLDQMMLLGPGRRSMRLAAMGALDKQHDPSLMKSDVIAADVRNAKKNNTPIPEICRHYLDGHDS